VDDASRNKMLALPSRNGINLPRFSCLPQEAVKKCIIAALCISATLASNAPAKDKKHLPATQDTHMYQGAIIRFPQGNGFIFSIGPFPIMIPPFIVQSEAFAGTAARVNHP
jgi:hypothetical protein